MTLLWWFRGVRLLRDEDLVRDLGERRFFLNALRVLRRANPTCRIDRDVRLVPLSSEWMQLGENVTISAGTVLAFGDDKDGYSKITVGDGTWIGQYNNLRSGAAPVNIGKRCLISQFCSLIASNHGMHRSRPIQSQPADRQRRGIVLEDDVWLGAGTVVTAGVTIGQGAVVGANAVVTHNIPPYEIWAGVPARPIGTRPG